MTNQPVRKRARPSVAMGAAPPTPSVGRFHNLHMTVTYRPVTEISSRDVGIRIHSEKQIEALKEAIKTFGMVMPIGIDGDGNILAGHARFQAARLAGLTTLPVVVLDHLSEAEQRAFAIADNRIGELAEWNQEELAKEFEFLLAADIDFSVEVTGFEAAEIDIVLSDAIDNEDVDDKEGMDDITGPPISRLGDIWCLGEHRLACADARDRVAFDSLMAGEKARLVFSDPPYNVAIKGNVSGKGRVKHEEFAMASGEMAEHEFASFLEAVFGHCVRATSDGALIYMCMDWRHMREMLAAGEATFTSLVNLCVWAKHSAGMGSFYRSQHELIFVWQSGTGPICNQVQLGRHGRNRTNVWSYPGATGFGANRSEDLAMHPTVKPVALVADAIRDGSRRGDIVLDCFGGSGTLIMAAEKTGRIARVMEIDPKYVDVAIRRWEKATGKSAILEGSNLSFSAVANASGRDIATPPMSPPASDMTFATRTRHRPSNAS